VDSHSKEIISVRTVGNINPPSVCELLELIRTRHAGTPVTSVVNGQTQGGGPRHRTALPARLQPQSQPHQEALEAGQKRTLTNRYYDCFDKFRLAIDACLEDLNGSAKSELDSLLTLNFQFMMRGCITLQRTHSMLRCRFVCFFKALHLRS
jgi:hypothetical protein